MKWRCLACRAEFNCWSNPCSSCGRFNTIAKGERPNSPPESPPGIWALDMPVAARTAATRVTDVSSKIDTVRSWKPFDTLTSGGLARSFVALVDGPKGSGKSTLATHVALRWPERTLYVAAEEDSGFVSMRARRLDANLKAELFVLKATSEFAEHDCIGYDLVVVDSLQGMTPNYREQLETVRMLGRWAQASKGCALITSRVNSSGQTAGWEEVPHQVDVCISLVPSPDDGNEVLATTTKNRNGARMNLVLSMGESGFSETFRTLDT